MKSPIPLILSILVGSMVCSCKQSGRSECIADLPMNQRALVEQRQIAVGFSADTVLLTWGKPSHITQRTANGQSLEEWRFDSRKAVQHPER